MSLNYTTVGAMILSFPHIGSLSTVNSAQLAGYAEEAESIIHGKISTLYTVPVTGSPPLLKTVATDLAIWRCALKTMISQTKGNHPMKYIAEDAMATLQSVVNGETSLVNSAGTVIETRTDMGVVWGNNMSYEPTFIDGVAFEVSVVDQDKIDQDLADRGLD